MFACLYSFADGFRYTPEQMKAKREIAIAQQEQKIRQIEAETQLEIAKLPQQRYDEAVEEARIACAREEDKGSLSAGEYVGLKLIGF